MSQQELLRGSAGISVWESMPTGFSLPSAVLAGSSVSRLGILPSPEKISVHYNPKNGSLECQCIELAPFHRPCIHFADMI